MLSEKVRVLVSQCFDPWLNLAIEDWIFRESDPRIPILFLWRNEPSVVMGRFQNPWLECDLKKMAQSKVKLARRQSGGGCVYHDLGNTNFTFMGEKKFFCKKANLAIVVAALGALGVEAHVNKRNDIIVDGGSGVRKISGSAFKELSDRSFHHGTLLIEADLENLGAYLNPAYKKITSLGIKSVRSEVANLSSLNSDITHQRLAEKLIDSFFSAHQTQSEIEMLDFENLEKFPRLQEYYQKMRSEKWCYGETPKFEHDISGELSCGPVRVQLFSHKGIITDVHFDIHSLSEEVTCSIKENLRGRPYKGVEIEQGITSVEQQWPKEQLLLRELGLWLSGEI